VEASYRDFLSSQLSEQFTDVAQAAGALWISGRKRFLTACPTWIGGCSSHSCLQASVSR
jgi:hypothetical protein